MCLFLLQNNTYRDLIIHRSGYVFAVFYGFFSLPSFLKNFAASGFSHATYLSALIISLPPALSASSLAGLSTFLNKKAPKDYSEIIFKNPKKPVNPSRALVPDPIIATSINDATLKVIEFTTKLMNSIVQEEDFNNILTTMNSLLDLATDDACAEDCKSIHSVCENILQERRLFPPKFLDQFDEFEKNLQSLRMT